MAENQEDRSPEDLTEDASPYRVEEFRQKGQVSQSRELSGMAAFLAAAAALYFTAPAMGYQISEFMKEVFRTDLSSRLDLSNTSILANFLMKTLKMILALAMPICLAGFAVGVIGSFSQIGAIFSMDPLTPDLDKVNPMKGLQRLFSMRTVVEGARLTGKLVVMLAFAYGLLKTEIMKAPSHILLDPVLQLGQYGAAGKAIFVTLFMVLACFAAFDFFLQKREFSKQTRLTKQEQKQEVKERDGDPMIKARIRTIQREMARKRMMKAVKTADVIITNPTHIAIALKYEKDKMAAPKIVAKGADFLAQKIKKIASDAGIPMVENVPLARTLYKTVKVGHAVPRALYQAVAEVLAYVYRLKNKGF